MTGVGDADGEPGLQNERTALAWRRTALAFVAVGALVARHLGGRPGLAALALLLLVAGVIGVEADRRYRRRTAALGRADPVVAVVDVAGMTGTVLVLSAVALAAVLAG